MKRKPVYCQQCKYILLIEKTTVLPLCLATARFRGSPLFPDEDVVGMTIATKRNKTNSCRKFTSRSILDLVVKPKRAIRARILEDLNGKEASTEKRSTRSKIQWGTSVTERKNKQDVTGGREKERGQVAYEDEEGGGTPNHRDDFAIEDSDRDTGKDRYFDEEDARGSETDVSSVDVENSDTGQERDRSVESMERTGHDAGEFVGGESPVDSSTTRD